MACSHVVHKKALYGRHCGFFILALDSDCNFASALHVKTHHCAHFLKRGSLCAVDQAHLAGEAGGIRLLMGRICIAFSLVNT